MTVSWQPSKPASKENNMISNNYCCLHMMLPTPKRPPLASWRGSSKEESQCRRWEPSISVRKRNKSTNRCLKVMKMHPEFSEVLTINKLTYLGLAINMTKTIRDNSWAIIRKLLENSRKSPELLTLIKLYRNLRLKDWQHNPFRTYSKTTLEKSMIWSEKSNYWNSAYRKISMLRTGRENREED